MRVLGESHDEIGTVFKLRALPQELEKLRERLRSS
jgi:hypothetical protein